MSIILTNCLSVCIFCGVGSILVFTLKEREHEFSRIELALHVQFCPVDDSTL